MSSNQRRLAGCVLTAFMCVFTSNGALAKKPVPPPPPDPINFHYEFVNIHDGELAEWSFPQGMNDGGFVVGNYGAFELGERPFVWPDPRSPATISMVDLNDLFDQLLHPNLVLTNAVDINDLDQVVGIARDTTTNVLGVYILTLPDAGDAFGTLNLLPDPGFRYMRVAALNDSGDVAGSHWPEGDLQSAFLYTVEDGFVNLGSLEGKPIRTYAMTNRDAADAIDVTGNTQPGQYANRAWRFTGYAGNLLDGNGDLVGGLVNLNTDYYKRKKGYLGYSWASDINDAGVIAGETTIAADDFRAALHDGQSWQSLGNLVGDLRDGLYDVDDSGAFGINNLGEVVGWSEMGEPSLPGHAFLYTPDLGMRDLSELTDGKPADLERFFPHRINVGGDICGPKFDGNYGPILQYRAYVLIRVAND